MARTRAEELDLDQFLGHSGSSGGGAFLKNWKEDERIDIWLHPTAKIVPLWSNTWVTIGKDRETKEPVIRTIRFNSMEREAILKRRYYRDDKTGELEFPPEVCPFAKLLEWVYQAIKSKDIGWVEPIFVFDEVAGEPYVIHSGGFIGMYSSKDLTKEDISEMRQAGIRRDEAWKESCQPRLQYIFRIVKNQEPGEGCLIALEAQALGDKVKKVISDRIDDVGRTKGDPFTTPYAFRWVYDDKPDFSKRYEARALTTAELTPEIQQVFDQEPPSINDLIRESNIRELRQSFEAHWCHKGITPPWDEIFAAAELELEGTDAAEDPASFNHGANVQDDESTEEEEVECDVCKLGMSGKEFTCPHCGTVYDPKTNSILEKGEWPKPEPKKGRSRSGRK